MPQSDLVASLSPYLFVGCAGAACWNLTRKQGSARAAYIWMSVPGTLLAVIYTAGYFYYLSAFDGPPLVIFFVVMWMMMYSLLNPGSWIFPIVIVWNVLAGPRPSDAKTWIGCVVLAALWVWGLVFDSVFLPKMANAFS
jgi:hypothetical protein